MSVGCVLDDTQVSRLREISVGHVIDATQVAIGAEPWVLSLASVSICVCWEKGSTLEDKAITISREL